LRRLSVVSCLLSEERVTKRDYKDLIVWQKAIDLVVEIYAVTKAFPKEELYGLTSQLRRCAVSVPSNIAEGQGRLTRGEFRQFLGHAKGSLGEMETQLIIAERLGYLKGSQTYLGRLAEVARLLNGLLNSLTTDN
jgi:four helix bundle protein